MREADLYPPIKALLEGQGYEVKGEVGAADVVARRGEEPVVIVELKLGFSLALFHQAVERLAVSDAVYVAVPRPGQVSLRRNLALARRLGLGVITVRPRDGLAEVLCDPGDPRPPRRSAKKAARLLRAFERLRGDPNAGGATRHGLVTGYRQDALACARFLAVHGASKAALVAHWTEVPEARRILADNHYGWFERVERGVYGLSAAGRRGLADYGEG
ncbi:hypothetical protein OG2516_17116 [Oceanicola granulosus HTCC2516]|uniref:Uncharacterized protein n=1 Tax=Oceanicola granulosus (strain ATCC BAA-861 / DSM 15982 / KCTC 12143 / HTCC2516) TaxID=314256 RepID=Q2CFM0_OCEGH|nr:DUF2161 family putative PD-(D/E)XK-type phosphodiesterase [Oceanicola granulosus]EAR51462.1 hypothetical protein OG2516_17116 [Oceanicola granulosus HTCC2516]